MEKKKVSPWAWIPTLYFAEGLPYVAVMTITVIMYKRLGISNTDIALYTSWLYLPWVIKPFWSPFVDLFKTKRWWIITMQFILGCGLAAIAFAIPLPNFFRLTLAIFWLIGFASATHDIAADGYYMLALDSHNQSLFVGIRSTFYRCATIFGQGILVIVAGLLEMNTGMEPVNIKVLASPEYSNEIVLSDELPTSKEENKSDDNYFITSGEVDMGITPISRDKEKEIKEFVVNHNIKYGFVPKPVEQSVNNSKDGWWSENISQPLGNWITKNFGNKPQAQKGDVAGAMNYLAIRLAKQPKQDKEIILNTAFNKGDKSISIISGERLEFNSENWDKPAYILFHADPKLLKAATTEFRGLSGNIPLAWSVTFFILAAFFILITFYHKFILPKPDTDKAATGEDKVSAKSIFKEFFGTFGSFFKKKQIWIAITFMLLYRFPEAQLVKLINPFLLDSKDLGGLGLTTGQVGIVYGTVGILGLTIGGIIGGIVAARGGLKKWLWPMAWSISLTCATFVYLSVFQPDSMFIINLCVFIEQFGYGFGFTAYMLYMIYFAEGEYKTAHYAICTAFMALGMMIPGMFAGWLQEHLGYENFFWWIMICCIATIAVTLFIKVDPSFGKKVVEEKNKN